MLPVFGVYAIGSAYRMLESDSGRFTIKLGLLLDLSIARRVKAVRVSGDLSLLLWLHFTQAPPEPRSAPRTPNRARDGAPPRDLT